MAATIKARARGLLRSASSLLGDKALPASVRQSLEGLRSSLKKKWADLELEAAEDEVEESEVGEASHREVNQALSAAISNANPNQDAWVVDVFPDVVIYNLYNTADEKYEYVGVFATSYAINEEDGSATIGVPYEVRPKTTYEAVGAVQESAAELEDVFLPLVESAVREDGTIEVKLIQPGWGSSGYYSAEVLERDGPKIFPAGTQMFWDHQTAQEEAAKPEGSLSNLAAVLTQNARYVKDHKNGPGLYSDSKVFSAYREAVEEMAPHIGTSIRASGKAKRGTIEGREGLIISELTLGKSVDFVTVPGAGGQIVEMFESKRPHSHKPVNQEDDDVSAEEIAKLKESNATLQGGIAALNARFIASEARNAVHGILSRPKYGAMGIPSAVQSKVSQLAVAGVVLTEAGQIDEVKLGESVDTLVRSEMAYIQEAVGDQYRVSGFGSSDTLLQESGEDDKEDLDASLAEAFARVGVSPGAAQVAAKGR